MIIIIKVQKIKPNQFLPLLHKINTYWKKIKIHLCLKAIKLL